MGEAARPVGRRPTGEPPGLSCYKARRGWGCGWGVVLALLATGPAQAAPLARGEVPEPLRPWIDWALRGHEADRCPFLDAPSTRECAWPSRLVLSLDEHGGKFTQQWLEHHGSDIPLPGDDTHWPHGQCGARSRS